jgi:hypothetical protein
LHARLVQCADGFAALPVDQRLDADVAAIAPIAVPA